MYLIFLNGGRRVRRMFELYRSHASQVAEVNVQIATERAEPTCACPSYT